MLWLHYLPGTWLILARIGGAWRSGTGSTQAEFSAVADLPSLADSKEDFRDGLIRSLVQETGLPVACVEYRWAPADPHPAQAIDTVAALSLLTGPLLALEAGTPRWNRQSIYLIGHSAGAFIAASIVLKPSSLPPSFPVPDLVRRSIRGVIYVDGIYDLPNLLDEYPTYSYFVDDAFGTSSQYLADESPARWTLHPPSTSPSLRFLVLHSKDDDLLSLRQPKLFNSRLATLLGNSAEDSSEGGRGAAGSFEVDYKALRGKHEELLKLPQLPLAAAKWIRRVELE